MQFTSDELRLVNLSGPLWIKTLKDRERRVLNQIYGLFKNGETDFIALLAEFAVIRDQIKEIESAIARLEHETTARLNKE